MKVDAILSKYNTHARDASIQFAQEGHLYTITSDPGTTYTSVTTWIHSYFEKFNADEIIQSMMSKKSWKKGHKYWGLSAEEIKELWNTNKDNTVQLGTELHLQIELFHNQPTLPKGYTNQALYDLYRQKRCSKTIDTPEWNYFMQFIQDHLHLTPYRTEWMIYDEDTKIAGSIDMVYQNPDGTFSIYDWKRSKQITRVNAFNKFALHPVVCHFPDSNFWQYALQLNTYRYIVERKYGIPIHGLFLVRLHPDAEEQNYELIELPDLQNEVCELMEERMSK